LLFKEGINIIVNSSIPKGFPEGSKLKIKSYNLKFKVFVGFRFPEFLTPGSNFAL